MAQDDSIVGANDLLQCPEPKERFQTIPPRKTPYRTHSNSTGLPHRPVEELQRTIRALNKILSTMACIRMATAIATVVALLNQTIGTKFST